MDVFVTLDSEDRLLATTKTPKVALGEVAFLKVSASTEFGAFVDWGMDKELLVPFAEQTADMRPSERYAVGLYVDKSDRLAGTMKVREMLESAGKFHRGEWVEGEAWREEPTLGWFVIVERRFVGLLPKHEPHGLRRGDAARFRVSHVHGDGKIELSVRALAHEEMDKDAARILEILGRPGVPQVGDRSTPEQIRALFGLSKKAFKRAVGSLLKRGQVDVDPDGFVRVLPAER
jgi:predicted RNA-binding protein (virulence factor B family)